MTDDRQRDGEAWLLPEDEAQRLLARAVELDAARRAGSSIARLREVALDAGVSHEAFDDALAELQARHALIPPPAPATSVMGPARATPRGLARRLWERLRGEPDALHLHPALIPIAGFAAGYVARMLRDPFAATGANVEMLLATALLFVASLVLAWQHGRDQDQGAFQRDVFGLWSAFALGWAVVHGAFWTDMVLVASGCWGGMALLGGVIVEMLRRRGDEQPHGSDAPSAA